MHGRLTDGTNGVQRVEPKPRLAWFALHLALVAIGRRASKLMSLVHCWRKQSSNVPATRAGGGDLAFPSSPLSSSSSCIDRTLFRDPQAQGPIFPRTFHLYIVLRAHIGGRCADPFRLWPGNRLQGVQQPLLRMQGESRRVHCRALTVKQILA
jgi:hypothetical protein